MSFSPLRLILPLAVTCFAVSCLAMTCLALPAAAQPLEGKRLAERWCAACHLVSKDQTKAADGVASFAAIGAKPDFDENRLKAFLAAPHPQMPDMALSRAELAALTAWIKAEGAR